MWELDHKESWALKNWGFWTVALEKTLESPLNCKEIKPLNPEGHQPWIFSGRTDAEAEAPILWPLDVKSQLIRKDPDAGKDWRQEEKVMTEDKMVGWHHWLHGHEFEHALGDGEGQGDLECCGPWSRTELDRTEQLNNKSRMRFWIQAGYELWSTLPIEARKEVRLKALKWCWPIRAKAYELVHENTLPQWLSWSKCTTWVKVISSY